MAILTVADARADLYTSLKVPTVTTLAQVFDHEPKPGDLPTPAAVTIFASAADPDFFTFSVRLYADERVDTAGAQRLLDTLMAAVESVYDAQTGPRAWTIGHDERFEALIAQADVQIGREDF